MTFLSKPMMFVATADPAAARAFYQDVLELSFVADEAHALVFHINRTIELRIQKVEQLTPAKHTVMGWAVDDMDEAVTSLSEKGVVFNRYPFLEQDERGVWLTPGGSKVAWFSDPDGNTLSLTQH